MFTDKIELKDIDKMDPEYKELLGHVLTIQADCEIGGPHLYVEKMLPAAPTKLDQLIVARTQQNYRQEWLDDLSAAREILRKKRTTLAHALPSDLLPSLKGNGLFARLLLWTVPAALPTRQNPDESWRHYLEAWRPGKPHRQTWDGFYAEAWLLVTSL